MSRFSLTSRVHDREHALRSLTNFIASDLTRVLGGQFTLAQATLHKELPRPSVTTRSAGVSIIFRYPVLVRRLRYIANGRGRGGRSEGCGPGVKITLDLALADCALAFPRREGLA